MGSGIVTAAWAGFVLAVFTVTLGTVWAVLNQAAQRNRLQTERRGIWILFWFSLCFSAIAVGIYALQEMGFTGCVLLVLPAATADGFSFSPVFGRSSGVTTKGSVSSTGLPPSLRYCSGCLLQFVPVAALDA